MQQMGAGRTLIDQENRDGNVGERNISESEGFYEKNRYGCSDGSFACRLRCVFGIFQGLESGF